MPGHAASWFPWWVSLLSCLACPYCGIPERLPSLSVVPLSIGSIKVVRYKLGWSLLVTFFKLTVRMAWIMAIEMEHQSYDKRQPFNAYDKVPSKNAKTI